MKAVNAFRMRRLVFVALLPLAASLAMAQAVDPVWIQLDRAREFYAAGEYGDALSAVQKARQTKHEITARRVAVLEAAFMPAEVRRVGDDLSLIRPVLVSRDDKEALDTLDILAKTRGASALAGSASKTLAWLRRSDVFPEADYLEGLIHDAEGETAIALRLYLQAWDNREFLDIPDQSYDILYRMAESSLGMGDRDTAEKDYLQILSDDEVYGTPDLPSPTLTAMKNTLVAGRDTAKFIKLYRHENGKAFKAASRIAELYLEDDASRDRALNSAILAACMAVSMADRVLATRRIAWDGTTAESLFHALGKSAELTRWATENGVWGPFMLLPRALGAVGNDAQAIDLLSALSAHCPDPVIAKKASGLRKTLSSRY